MSTLPAGGDANLYWLRPEHLAAYRGHALLLTDNEGRIWGGDEGFYFYRTRFLSRLRMKVNGEPPQLASANQTSQHAIIAYYVAPTPEGDAAGPNPKQKGSGGDVVKKAIELHVNCFVGDGLHLDLHVTNHALISTQVTLSFELDADFADQTEAQQGKRQQRAPVAMDWSKDTNGATLCFRYLHDVLRHGTHVRLSGADFVRHDRRVRCTLTLSPQAPIALSLDVAINFGGVPVEPYYGVDGAPRRSGSDDQLLREWTQDAVRLSSANMVVMSAWDRAVADLGSLPLFDGTGLRRLTPAAGIPKYLGLFGRDTLMASWQSALLSPTMLRGTIELLADWIATERDDRFDAEPGKVMHQHQLSPLAMLGKQPFLHYYGDYSAPPLFLLGLATEFAHTGDRDFLLGMRESALRILEWLDNYGDADRDGFYEFETRAGEAGIKNQGWKDSNEAILYEDGKLVPNPIAVCEVQALVYAAKHRLGLAFAEVGEHQLAERLLAEAGKLKQRFNQAFWLPQERYFAFALDPAKRPVGSIASDPAACLAYGIIDEDKSAPVAERVMAPDLFSGWGVRTLSSKHPAYNPFAYHLGAVWPSPNAIIATGLKRYGFGKELHLLCKGLFDASTIFHLHRLPEALGGQPRDQRHPHPGIYPGACSPQAWSASAVILLVNALLGMLPLAPKQTLIVDPDLPDWLPDITLRGVHVGAVRASIRFLRNGQGGTDHEVMETTGSLRIVRAPEQDRGQDRVAAALRAFGGPPSLRAGAPG